MSHSIDDFIRSSGNLAFVNTWLKLIVLVLFLTAVLLGAVLAVKIVEGRTERVLPIIINQATGDALAVDFSVMDAAGEQRAPSRSASSCEDFLGELFTYNRFTVKTNLESVVKWATPEAWFRSKRPSTWRIAPS